jgi:hypothetical protein
MRLEPLRISRPQGETMRRVIAPFTKRSYVLRESPGDSNLWEPSLLISSERHWTDPFLAM